MSQNRQFLITTNSILLVWGVFLLVQYRSIFGGDPEIHLIFAKHLLEGHVLEFNPGYKTGGETSPFYMLIVALMYLLSNDLTQYAMKALGIFSLALICFILHKATESSEQYRKMLTWVLFVSMTFIPFQAMLGMENTLFAALTLLIIYLDYKVKLPSVILPLLLPVMFLLRPEAIFLVLYFMFKGITARNAKLIGFSILSASLCVAFYVGMNYFTGVDTQNAGSIRALTSKIDSLALSIGNQTIYLNKKPLIGFSYAWILLGLISIYRKKLKLNDLLLLSCFFVLPLALHFLNIFPNSHFSRYVIYCYAVIFFVFAIRVVPVLSTKLIVITYLLIFTISVLEFNQRKSLGQFDVQLSVKQMRKQSIKQYSDNLFNQLSGNKKTPIVLATTEVQLRGRLDERFLVWSLDGITDAHLSKFAINNSIDHFGYIRFRNVDYLQDLPNYNIDRSKISLLSFNFNDEGRSQCIRNTSLLKEKNINLYRVIDCLEK